MQQGPGVELQVGKEQVGIVKIEPVGHYAIRIHFDDGHNTGLYSWDALYDLGENEAVRWADYVARCEAAAQSPPAR